MEFKQKYLSIEDIFCLKTILNMAISSQASFKEEGSTTIP